MNAIVAVTSLMFLTVAVAGCAAGTDDSADPTQDLNPLLQNQYSFDDLVPVGSVRFVIIGDQGSGVQEKQDEVAEGIVEVCKRTGCNFALTAGDNIYNVGARNEYDPQFEDKFEIPYKDVDMPFFLVLGNHDNGDGGAHPEVGDYQVLYSKRTDRTSDKWNMPARYYRHSVGDVTVVGLDSGPAEVSTAPAWAPNSRGAAMQTWLADEIPKITTKWKFALAHHAYWSNSRHQDAGAYDGVVGRGLFYQRLLESTVCGKVDVFFAGHDHNLQWLKQAPNCPRTELIISGAGGNDLYGPRAAGKHEAYFEDYTHHGFWWVDVTGNTFTATAYDETGEELFTRSFTKGG